MIDAVSLGKLLMDFTCLSADTDGYPTMAALPAFRNFLEFWREYNGELYQ